MGEWFCVGLTGGCCLPGIIQYVVKVGYPALSERLGAIRYYKLTYR